MQYKSNLKQITIFSCCKNYTATTRSRAGQIRNILQTQKNNEQKRTLAVKKCRLAEKICEKLRTCKHGYRTNFAVAGFLNYGVANLDTKKDIAVYKEKMQLWICSCGPNNFK